MDRLYREGRQALYFKLLRRLGDRRVPWRLLVLLLAATSILGFISKPPVEVQEGPRLGVVVIRTPFQTKSHCKRLPVFHEVVP